jgi:hypothetical protein
MESSLMMVARTQAWAWFLFKLKPKLKIFYWFLFFGLFIELLLVLKVIK